jgi:hypothetical protein
MPTEIEKGIASRSKIQFKLGELCEYIKKDDKAIEK